MTYGEKVIEGDETEYIISTYCCHPSMVNDNAAGMAMWADLLAGMPEHTKHTYRFIIAPETIGMIAYLATHDVSKVKGAVILSHVVGKDGTEPPTFKQSYLGNSYMDRIARQVVTRGHEQRFSIRGGDERQLSSPAFRIPTILLNKAGLYGTYYHTSLDREYNLTDYNATLHAAREMVYLLEHDKTVDSLNPHAEPMMGKRNLYSNLGGDNQKDKDVETLMWTMFYSDSSLLDIAEKTRIPMQDVIKAAETLERNKLIK
jgi:aminopeptidase-like protein